MTTQETRPTLGPAERETLAGLADELIPSSDSKPSASQAEVSGTWVDRVLESRPDMAAELVSLLKAVEGQDPREAVERLQSQPGTQFDTLKEVVAGAYFLNPEVNRVIGYPGKQDIPVETTAEDLETLTARLKELTAPVVERGSVYRPCP
jgi:NDP-sugar pyrophosphorylase family protein